MWGLTPRWRRPTPKKDAWMPKRAGPPDPAAEVPAKYRRLRLRRTRRTRRMEPSYVAGIVIVLVFVTVFGIVVAGVLFR